LADHFVPKMPRKLFMLFFIATDSHDHEQTCMYWEIIWKIFKWKFRGIL